MSRRGAPRLAAGSPGPSLAPSRGGFALIIVLAIIFVLAMLAGGFAYSMKVESRLAANANNESEIEWMGRSGVELAKYVLDQSARLGVQVTSLNQIWAGGPGDLRETNSPLMGINLNHYELGPGVISVKITDLERKLNINSIGVRTPVAGEGGPILLQRALSVMGVPAGDISVIADSIVDWRDPDDHPTLSGVESDYYLGLDPPYVAKNGPIDDLAELLLVNGVTPEIYWGPRAAAHQQQLVEPRRRSRYGDAPPTYPVGLVDLFTPISSGMVNINTASLYVLQIALGVSEDIAANIIRFRAGFDGVDGTEDDTPFTNPTLAGIPGFEGIPPVGRATLSTTSTHFEVVVDVRLANTHRQCVAILGRGLSGGFREEGNVKVLQFSWR